MQGSSVHIIVLAAGRGNRLGALGDDTPKWLLPIRDTTVARRQLDAVRLARRRDPNLDVSVTVVTGHAADTIDRFAVENKEIGVQTIYNTEYLSLNNWYSLLVGLRSLEIQPNACIIVFNADLLAPVEWIAQFVLDCAQTPENSLVAVDLARPLTDEAMKVSVGHVPASPDAGPMLTKIGKEKVDDPVGEYVGMLMAQRSVLAQLRETLESFVGKGDLDNAWYEYAVGTTAAEGAQWRIWPTPDSAWVEIDDDADYSAALDLVDLYAVGLSEST
jgi:choline kinase